jgi:hypothetical protein
VRAGRCSIACRNTYVHSRAVFVQSIVRRFGRWLENDRIDVHALYGPFMPQALAEWGNHVLYLALDTSMWWDTDCLVRLALVYRGRVVLIVWTVDETAPVAATVMLKTLARRFAPMCISGTQPMAWPFWWRIAPSIVQPTFRSSPRHP